MKKYEISSRRGQGVEYHYLSQTGKGEQQSIHDLGREMPFAIKHQVITEELLPYTRALQAKLGVKPNKHPKLAATQYGRE